MRSEVSMLPSTSDVKVYQCIFDGIETIHLVDLPGMVSDTNREKQLLEQVTNSDLIIWLLKANQPARELDIQFKGNLDNFYKKEQNRSRKRPVIIGVLNQVDRLKPVAEWEPPYDLHKPSSEKAITIVEALEYNQNLMGLDTMIPLSIADNKTSFNLSMLKLSIDQYYENGIQAQLNRRRIESGDRLELTEQARRVYQAGKSLFGITYESR